MAGVTVGGPQPDAHGPGSAGGGAARGLAASRRGFKISVFRVGSRRRAHDDGQPRRRAASSPAGGPTRSSRCRTRTTTAAPKPQVILERPHQRAQPRLQGRLPLHRDDARGDARALGATAVLTASPRRFVDLPASTPSVHVSRSIAFGKDGRLYVAIGSSCNVCVEPSIRAARPSRCSTPTARTGSRSREACNNAIGFDWDPRPAACRAGDTGQDGLGDEAPPEEINLIEAGKHYGFPFHRPEA